MGVSWVEGGREGREGGRCYSKERRERGPREFKTSLPSAAPMCTLVPTEYTVAEGIDTFIN